MSIPLWKLDATETVSLISSKKVSARSVVESHLSRLDEVNPKINAITQPIKNKALKMADLADDMVSNKESLGPLHGVPITIKDNVDVAGQTSPNGVAAMKDIIASADSPVVSNLLKAGAIPIGRTNTPEFSLRWHTGNPLFGDTLNPWDENLTPGGSSGGAAASLASGIACIAHGNDLGGSLRYPAYCCGLTTIKPSQGVIPAFNPTAKEDRPLFMQLMSTQGPIGRSVEDVRLALSVMVRQDIRDPWWTPSTKEEHYAPKLKTIALATQLPGTKITSAVDQSLQNARQILERAGYAVKTISPPEVFRCMEIWAGLIGTEVRTILRTTMDTLGSDQIRNALDYLESFADECSLEDYIRLGMERTRLMREWALFLEKYPLIVGPVSNIPPFKPNEDIKSQAHAERIFKAQGLMISVNLLGLPAATVCTGLQNQKPFGVQIISSKYNDQLCLDVAKVIEDEVGKVTPIDPICR